MSQLPGTRLGPYEVVSAIGAGGMGEVYKARDTKLNRDVAIKVLPPAFAQDRDRLARFAREAQSLAALNHPHVAQIYGLIDLPAEGGRHMPALVMEFADGEDLAARLTRGAIPLNEALPLAMQIAAALEAAHERGIIHRDLKPANIKVTDSGAVKVLDFGLAKAMAPELSGVGQGFSPANPGSPLQDSPTFTSPAMTQMGVILGTAAYMAPEQAKGKAVDRRADVWAFGGILFEMLAGKRAFEGDDVTDVIASIMRAEPDWTALPAATPPAIRKLLRRCLEKDRAKRLDSMGVAKYEIEDALANPGASAAAPPPAPASRRAVVALGALAVAALLLSGYLAWLAWRPAPASPVIHFRVEAPIGTMGLIWNAIALSPDGTRMAVTWSHDAQKAGIYLRPLDSVEMTPVAGTRLGFNPFFSPDGKWLAFTSGERKLMRAPVAGGPPQMIVEAGWGGGSWGADDVIVFTPQYTDGLWKVNATGGKAEKITEPDQRAGELGHWWPQHLPDGTHVIYTSFSTPLEKSRLMLRSLETGEQRMLVEGAVFGRVLPSGHLLYARAQAIYAVPFDLDRRQVTGPELAVLDDVAMYPSNAAAQFAVASNGTMAFMPRREAFPDTELVWVDRRGGTTPTGAPRRRYTDMRLSPDGRRVAATIDDGNRDIWTYDFDRGVLGRVTSAPGSDFEPVWTRDGKRIVFASETPVFQIFSKAPLDSAAPEALVNEAYDTEPMDVSPDGQLLYTFHKPGTRHGIGIRPLTGTAKGVPLIDTKYSEQSPALSPDGKWLAYTSDESGRVEVYVQAFPAASERWQVTTDGGVVPRWGHNGRELFYGAGPPDRLSMVAVSFGAEGPTFGKPTTAYLGNVEDYGIARDGRILVLRRDPQAPTPTIHVVVNWIEELRAKLASR